MLPILELGLTPIGTRIMTAALELHRRLLTSGRPERKSVKVPEEVAAIMRPHANDTTESFWCLPLDPRSRLIGEPVRLGQGDVDGTDAPKRGFIRTAIRNPGKRR